MQYFVHFPQYYTVGIRIHLLILCTIENKIKKSTKRLSAKMSKIYLYIDGFV